jgi:hypothetical protein
MPADSRPDPTIRPPAAEPAPSTPAPVSGPPRPNRSETEEEQALRSARACVHQLARTLKICRLYESSSSPTVARFIEDLATMLEAYLELRGRLELRFTANDVFFQDASIYPAKSREDNLALPFYQDGIRKLVIEPGLLRRELQTLLDAILRVTSATAGDDDLVTLLWEAHLEHVELQYVPAEGDLGGGATESEEAAAPVEWPEPRLQSGENDSVSQTAIVEEGAAGDQERSDDWAVTDRTAEVEAGYAELEQLSLQEAPRFLRDFEAEHEVPLTTTAIALVQTYLSVTGLKNQTEFGLFVPRVLREALDNGRWVEATEALGILMQLGPEGWSRQQFLQEIVRPDSVTSIVTLLDQQDDNGMAEFVSMAGTFGNAGFDLVLGVLAEVQSRRHRRLLCKVVEDWAGEEPQRLGAWIADPRWHVVRNIAYILGQIRSQATVPLLATLTGHPEPRVQIEAVNALGNVDPLHTRSVFRRLLEHRDPKIFVTAVGHLAIARDPEMARMFVQFLTHPDFPKRSEPERRAVYRAVAETGGPEVVRDLEAEMHRGGFLVRNAEEHRQEVARCLAGIGGTEARVALERAAASRRTPVRRAAEIALAIFDSPRGRAAA